MSQYKEPTCKDGNAKANIKILSAMQKHDRVMNEIRRVKKSFEEKTISFNQVKLNSDADSRNIL